MTARKLQALLSAAAVALAAASCSSDPKNEDYPASALKFLPSAEPSAEIPEAAYKGFLWSDSIAKVEAALKDVHPWTGDPFGVYVRSQVVNGVLLDVWSKSAPPPKDGKELSPEKKLEEAKKLLPKKDQDDFIIKKMAFSQGKSDVTIYWFEINDPTRPSRFVDRVVWSKMCLARVFYYDPPLSFDRVRAAQEERFGQAQIKYLKEDNVWDWYKKVDPRASYHPEKEYVWRKGALSVLLYDWRNPEEESGRSELEIRNDAVFKEFEGKIRERIESVAKEKAAKTEESASKALAY